MRSLSPIIIKIALYGIVFFAALTHLAIAQTPDRSSPQQLSLDGAQSSEAFARHMGYYLDAGGELTIDNILSEYDDRFTALTTPTPQFGFTKDRIWLRTKIQNKTSDIDTWYIHVHENFLPNYEVFLLRSDGKLETLESQSPKTRFSERSVDFPELATAMSIAPDEGVTLYIAYKSGGSSNITITLETEDSFTKSAIKRTSKNFISYGMMMIVIATSFLALLILKRRVFLSYFLYVVVILFFLMHSDGVTFQYIWPNAPRFNNYVSIIIGLAFAIVPYDFAREFLRTKTYHPRWDKFMGFMMIAMPVFIIPVAFIDPQQAKRCLMLLVLISISAGTLLGIIAAFSRFKEVRFYVLAWFFGAGSAIVMNLRHFTDSGIGQHIELDSIRLAIVVDSIMMGLGVADRYSQQANQRRRVEARNLEQAQTNLALSDRLNDLEEQFRLATELVHTRDVELKNTIHDLRQPLHALRLNVEKLRTSAGFDNADTKELNTTFTYLETLIASHLQNTVIDGAPIETENGSDSKGLTLSATLNAIYDMFEPDAVEKGLEFRFVDTSQTNDIKPIILMRIITNILSNAIKYTESGKILMGVRRFKDGLRIEIHDTGPGLSEADFAKAKIRSIRLDEPKRTQKKVQIKGQKDSKIDGMGLGLDIANELAQNNGITLSILPNRKTGTSIAIKLPKTG